MMGNGGKEERGKEEGKERREEREREGRKRVLTVTE